MTMIFLTNTKDLVESLKQARNLIRTNGNGVPSMTSVARCRGKMKDILEAMDSIGEDIDSDLLDKAIVKVEKICDKTAILPKDVDEVIGMFSKKDQEKSKLDKAFDDYIDQQALDRSYPDDGNEYEIGEAVY